MVITRGDRTLMMQRPDTGMWSSLWEPPTVESHEALNADDVRAQLPVALVRMTSCGQYVHQTTHRRVVFHVYRGTTRVRRGRWVARAELDDLPMSNAHRRLLHEFLTT